MLRKKNVKQNTICNVAILNVYTIAKIFNGMAEKMQKAMWLLVFVEVFLFLCYILQNS
jgi:hypothetical protein